MTYSDEFLKMKADAIANSIGKSGVLLKVLPTGEILRDAIIRMRTAGKTFSAIRDELKCSLCTIHYHLDKDAGKKADMRKRKFVANKKEKEAKGERLKAKGGKEKVVKAPTVAKVRDRSQDRVFKTKTVLPGQKVRVQINHKTWIEVAPEKVTPELLAKYETALAYDKNFKHGRF